MKVESSKGIIPAHSEISFKHKNSEKRVLSEVCSFNFGEEMIDQGIETIEFVLGIVRFFWEMINH